MKHWFIDEWRIDSREGWLDCSKLFNHILINQIPEIVLEINDIAYKTLNDEEKNTARYTISNLDYPMIISNMPNPYNRKYRLLDGRHRMHKMIEQGCTQAKFYNVAPNIVLKFTTWAPMPFDIKNLHK